MLTKTLSYFALSLLALSNSLGNSEPQSPAKSSDRPSGTLEKMIVASGTVAMDLDLNRLGIGVAKEGPDRASFHFEVRPNSFFTIRVFNEMLRGPEQGSMELIPGNSEILPEPLKASTNRLVVERIHSGKPFDLVVRDGPTGFVFFNVEGELYEYDAASSVLGIKGGRLLFSEELANKLGRPAESGAVVGEISIAATMEPIEITTVSKGVAQSTILPPRAGLAPGAPDGSVPGPDIIVGDLPSLEQFGASGSQVGLGVGTTSCNNGNVEVDWFSLPDTDHCVIPQNFYRLSGGPDNRQRFEQIGQSWMKHAFFALQDNACGFGCIPAASGEHLGVGCSDPYDASLNADQDSLGSRAWVNPFTGAFPSTSANHTGHAHTGTSHRLIVEANDLNTEMNRGATYFAEAQYVTPHEYAWCQTHPGECNMYNNASYRQFSVAGTSSFTFSPIGSTMRMTSAINAAWPGATVRTIEPAPGVDGRAFLAYKVSFSGGVYHYEYAIYNQNLDRGIQSLSIPLPTPSSFSNGSANSDRGMQSLNGHSGLGFHAPPQHPGFANDGTEGDAGFSDATWTLDGFNNTVIWHTETFAENPNANAIRWGTLYNFWFSANRPPVSNGTATIGFFKTGQPISVSVDVPEGAHGGQTPTATPTPPPICGFFSNPETISIPAPGGGSISSPYPSNISVSGLGGAITKMTVAINGITHNQPADIDVLLVGPDGQSAIIMSDVGGYTGAAAVNLVLDDAAANPLPNFDHLVSGTFRPTNIGECPGNGPGIDPFPPPAPPPPSSGVSALAVFNGTNPNGTWSLYVVDDFTGASGLFTGGWSISILTDDCAGPTPAPIPTPTPGRTTHFGIDVSYGFGFGAFTVTALDGLNRIVPNYRGRVHFTTSDHQCFSCLSPDSFLNNGSGTFFVSFPEVFTYQTITATDVNDPTITGTSICVFANKASQTPPPTPTPGPPTPSPTTSPSPTPACILNEQFNNVSALPSSGWRIQNNSSALGITSWFSGVPAIFSAQSGNPDSYVAANFNAGEGATISDWLFTPTLTLRDGGVFTFWTRTVDSPTYPDRLQVRLSTNGESFNVGTSATSVGDFATLLIDINPTYTTSGYPNVWTQYTITLSGIASPVTGRLAFRYFVEDGGPNGTNSDFIGIDTVSYDCGAPPPTPTPASLARALNLSTRLRVETGALPEDNVGIGGFIITGAQAQVLVRGLGPSLGAMGVSNPLVDPVLELHGTGGVITLGNNNWRDTQEAAIIATGIAPSNDLESAILAAETTLPASLDPGAYTVVLKGRDIGSGLGLMEIYDLSKGNSSKLANLSTRALVGTGSDVVIAGFILGGGSSDDVILLRGIGPSLSQSGLSNPLANPTLELRNGEGAVLASNDNWQDGPSVSLPPSDALESAIETSLQPGAYTALLSGVNNGTGVGLVEVYDLGTPQP